MKKKRIEIDAMCSKCKEWCTISAEDNGCCDAGGYAEGSHWTYEDFLEDEEQDAELVVLPRGVQ